MKIGLLPDHLMVWQGGRDFFAMLFDSLGMASHPEDEIRILSIARRETRPWRVARIGKHLVSRFPPDLRWVKKELTRPSRSSVISSMVGQKVKVELVSELSHRALACGYSPDVIGPCLSKPHDTDVPCVGYIPDCQHCRMPNFFSAEEIGSRNTLFATMLRELPVVIVNSADSRLDLIRFFPDVRAEIVILPFAASPSTHWLAIDGNACREKYGLPQKYFLCSSQFWQHKNHGVVMEALALARAEGRPISMVFTGAMEDYRAPTYVSELMSRVRNLGIVRDCFFLGLVPKRDQIGIMKSALAVVQPTQFEGTPGGLAVYDAISVGRPVIVSDIPVNREIEKYVDVFFCPSDPASLLRAMRRIESVPQQNKASKVLLAEGRARRRHCGAVIRSAFALAVERSMASKRN
jgi:glycosyltransferase involved in cell wall biosynthesis